MSSTPASFTATATATSTSNDPNPDSNSNLDDANLSLPQVLISSPSTSPSNTDSDYRLYRPFIQRPIRNLNSSNSFPRGCPTSKSTLESIDAIKITENSFVEIDSIIICAICKERFAIDDEAKQLPCKHMYHSDCILPWLSMHSSCPLCRFQLPSEYGLERQITRRRRSRVLTTLGLDDEELFGNGVGLRGEREDDLFSLRVDEAVVVSPQTASGGEAPYNEQ